MEQFFKPNDMYDDVSIRHAYYLNLYYGVFQIYYVIYLHLKI